MRSGFNADAGDAIRHMGVAMAHRREQMRAKASPGNPGPLPCRAAIAEGMLLWAGFQL